MTQARIKSVLSLCRHYKNRLSYREHISLLFNDILQAKNYSLEDLKKIEAIVISNKEEISTLSIHGKIH